MASSFTAPNDYEDDDDEYILALILTHHEKFVPSRNRKAFYRLLGLEDRRRRQKKIPVFASLVVLVSGGLTTFSFSFSSDTVDAVPSSCGAAASMSSCKSLDALLNVMISASCLMSSTILFAFNPCIGIRVKLLPEASVTPFHFRKLFLMVVCNKFPFFRANRKAGPDTRKEKVNLVVRVVRSSAKIVHVAFYE